MTDFLAALESSNLGKEASYATKYDPGLLFAIERAPKRAELGVEGAPFFFGVDTWNAYEISWLNNKGKPEIAVAEFKFPCESPNLIESKSFKLYLNSFNNSTFESFNAVKELMQKDLSEAAKACVGVKLIAPSNFELIEAGNFDGICVDDIDAVCDSYTPDAKMLKCSDQIVSETLHSNLLRSNCPCTGQPDWGSVQITYEGRQISHEGLLQYIVSFRNHQEFHEQCIERIFLDVRRACKPTKLIVHGRYTRRGGLDINPFRSSEKIIPKNTRLFRQ